MKKIALVLLAMVILGGCTPKAYWKQDVPWKVAKEDYDRCVAISEDQWKQGKFSWDNEAKQWIDKCMKEKGYILRNKEEAYNPPPPPLGGNTGWGGK